MGEKTSHDRLVDAVLLARFYDTEPGAYEHGEEQFISDIRIEYPEHVDDADWVVRRVLKAQAAETAAQDPALSRDGRGE